MTTSTIPTYKVGDVLVVRPEKERCANCRKAVVVDIDADRYGDIKAKVIEAWPDYAYEAGSTWTSSPDVVNAYYTVQPAEEATMNTTCFNHKYEISQTLYANSEACCFAEATIVGITVDGGGNVTYDLDVTVKGPHDSDPEVGTRIDKPESILNSYYTTTSPQKVYKLNVSTNQEAFDAVVRHLASLDKRCTEDGVCKYAVANSSARCAIGALIDAPAAGLLAVQASVDGFIMGRVGTTDLPARLDVGLVSARLLSNLQDTHDAIRNWGGNGWSSFVGWKPLRAVADEFGLRTDVLLDVVIEKAGGR